MKIHNYNEFINEESKIKKFIISMLFGLGLSQAEAQYIDTIQKANIIETLHDYNKSPYNISELKSNLRLNSVVDVDSFIQRGLIIRPDNTIKIKPNFVKNLEIFIDPRAIALGIIDNPFSNTCFGFKLPIKNK